MSPTKLHTKPGLRFPEFEGTWENRTLREHGISVVDGDRGKNYPNGDDFSPMGYCLFLNAKNVTSSGFAFNEVSFISEEKDRQLSKGKLKPDDVVLTTRGTVGNIAFFDSNIPYRQMRINSGMVLLRAIESKISPQFLYSAFFAPPIDGEVKKTAFGSAQPQLTVKGIYALKFGAPTLPEQRKIAGFLTAVDGRIGQLSQKKALLENYKKGVMQQLFTQALRFKDDHGNEFPAWEEKTLGDAVIVNPKTSDLPDSFIYIDLESVNAGVLHSPRRISKIDAPSRAQRLLKRGDILYQTVRPYQMNNYLFDLEGVHVASTGYAQLRASKTDAHFIYHSLHLPRFVGDVMDRCTGTSYPAINSKDLAQIAISIPSLPEQIKIANFLTGLDRKIESVANQISHTQAFKKGLLQQMFV